MCGIVGWMGFDNRKLLKSDLISFTDTLAHRGPDSSNSILLENSSVGLGHRRLSILDLSSDGTQPYHDQSGRYSMVYNGEVFNFLELKKALQLKGFKFITTTDTEVVLSAFIYWGPTCLNYFNGMWAIAIWDNIEKKFWLARDRFGVKPLYFVKTIEFFAFASETNSFKKLSGFNRDFNNTTIRESITDSFILEGYGKTIFKDIKSLKPGYSMEIDLNGKIIEKRWWSTEKNLVTVPNNYNEQIHYFKNLLYDACKIRLRSDVPIATALSGGLDSSSVYSVLRSISSNNHSNFERAPISFLQAFSAIFPGTEQDEKKYAEFLLDATNQNITWVQDDKFDLVSHIENSVKHLDFIYNTPLFMGASVYKAMAQYGIKVSMDGHGVDEMMYGYAFSIKDLADYFIHYDAEFANELWDIYSEMFLDRPIRPEFYKDQLYLQNHLIFKLKKYFRGLKNRSNSILGFDLLYNQFHFTMLPTILRNFDKMSMQHGIEIRMPFMDYRIVSFVFSLPLSSKIGNGYTKRILRDAMKGLLPEEIRLRKNKMGLNAPMQSWFSGPLKEYINDEVLSSSFQNNCLFDGKAWLEFLEIRNIKQDWSFQDAQSFWSILNAHILMKN